jgi:hypothetical protein
MLAFIARHMRLFVLVGLLVLKTIDLLGQGEVRGKIVVNGHEFINSKSGQTYFDFKPLTPKLSKNGKRYLDAFADFYSTQLKQGDSLTIIVDPGLSPKEMKVVNNDIGLARAWTVHNYLKEKYGIEIPKAIVRETYTSCILTGRITKRQVRKAKE